MRSEEMRATLSGWKESGLSLRAFGIREGVSYSKLVYWRRRLEPVKQKVELAPVRVLPAPEPPAAKSETIAIWLPNGVSLDVPPGASHEGLGRLVEILSQC